MRNPFLMGTKVYLRPLERADAPRIVPWLNDPEVTRTLAIYRPLNLQSEEEFIAKLYQDEHRLVLGIALQQADQLIGASGLEDIDFKNRHAVFGIFIGEKAEWGKGYGAEATRLMLQHAFETLNLNRVRLQVYETNARGRRLYEKIGFTQEGVLRQERYAQGRYWNAFLLAMLREEWEALKQRSA